MRMIRDTESATLGEMPNGEVVVTSKVWGDTSSPFTIANKRLLWLIECEPERFNDWVVDHLQQEQQHEE